MTDKQTSTHGEIIITSISRMIIKETVILLNGDEGRVDVTTVELATHELSRRVGIEELINNL